MAMAARIITLILWSIMALLTMTQYVDAVAEQDVSAADKVILGLIFIIGAPVFCAYAALSGLLDYILPDGWDDDEDFKH